MSQDDCDGDDGVYLEFTEIYFNYVICLLSGKENRCRMSKNPHCKCVLELIEFLFVRYTLISIKEIRSLISVIVPA